MIKNLYSDDQHLEFSALFSHPGARYRDAPFWAWNCKLDGEELIRQIGVFRQMGMGGFHIHARTGLETPYLGPEFLKQVRRCVAEAKDHAMYCYLYDEDRWPSGSAGGQVTRNPAFRMRYLLVTPHRRTEAPDVANDNSGTLLASYAIRFDQESRLLDYHRLADGALPPDNFEVFYAYLMVENGTSWFNDQTYVDTLNPLAIQEFTKMTHEVYRQTVGQEFGHTIPSIFTDEPQFSAKAVLKFASDRREMKLPYTNDLPESYRAQYGCDFFETVPELFWERADRAWSTARYRFHDHIAERFATAFADTVGGWCQQNGLLCTGHMVEEPTLESQTTYLGEAMRNYRSFHLPGIDMLCDWCELTTVKQAVSVSRQFGRGGVLCELDGVTDWDFSFAGHKGHGDWQAALGVTLRVPHLSWLSMAGEAKRDYPASISDQSPWWKKYPLIADHFARINVAMTRGKAVCRIGMIHPVESYWLLYGPQDQTAGARHQSENDFSSLCRWLLQGLIDFDYIAESLLPKQPLVIEDGIFKLGEMAYETIVVPPVITLRSSTLEYLEAFVDAGGEVIFVGNVAVCCDAELSGRAAQLAARCRRIDCSETALLDALRPRRDIEVLQYDNGFPAESLFYQLRESDGERFLLIVNTERNGRGLTSQIRIAGHWQLEYLDTATGECRPLAAARKSDQTILTHHFFAHSHLLLRLTPAPESIGMKLRQPPASDAAVEQAILTRLDDFSLPITLDEPNVLVLDQAEWRLGNEAWHAAEEFIRLDNLVRARLGLRPRTGDIVQPWASPANQTILGELALRYRIECAIQVRGAFLALEQPETTTIFLDGKELPCLDAGFWCDRAIRKIVLPELSSGRHELVFLRPYRVDTHIESAFILGDFGVEVGGAHTRIIAPIRALHWGDAGCQGLPFYSGNLTYHCEFSLSKTEQVALRFPSRSTQIPPQLCNYEAARECEFAAFRAVAAGVSVDGTAEQLVAFAPFQTSLGTLATGKHTLDITLYGSRVNSFGALHLSWRISWMGPNAWRGKGDYFTHDYRTRPFGVMLSPLLLREIKKES